MSVVHRSNLRIAVARWLCVLLALTASVGCRRAPRARFAKAVVASAIGRLTLRLAAHATLDVQVSRASSGARPVLHLWDPEQGAEVAHVAASWFDRRPRLQFQNPSDEQRSYELVVRARDNDARGYVDLVRAGKPLAQHVPAGGTLLRLAAGTNLEYRVAPRPGAQRRASLWTVAADARLLAVDASGGPTGLPRLRCGPGVSRQLLAADAGSFDVYANDDEDRDGDGVGRRLERALGTCDAPSDSGCADGPLAAYYRAVDTGTRDTDRDGLGDADELFGVSAPLLDFPRYGSDPRHKDVYVEIDHSSALDSVGFSEDELARIAALFRQGSAHDLRNPDGRRGIALHFDAGMWPRDPRHRALFGDYAGSGTARESDYRAARRSDFSPSRIGYFRYAFSTRTGRGQALRDALTVNRDLQRVTIFAHELGHTLGLAHHGHDAWGRANCKPNYYSIMNYLYQNRVEIGFSRRAAKVLNPLQVFERGALLRGEPAAALSDSPLELDVRGRDVDWNRDGVISDEPVRAGLLWATYKSCAAAEHGLITLAEDAVADATPVLLRSADQLFAFWLDAAGRLQVRKRRVSRDPRVVCAELGVDGCAFGEPASVVGLPALRHIAGLALDGDRIALAATRADARLVVTELAARTWPLRAATPLELVGVNSDHAPSLLRLAVDERYFGARSVLALIFRAAGPAGELWQASMQSPGGPFVLRRVLDRAGRPVCSARAPTTLALPTGESCGVFPDPEGFMRLFCYDAHVDRWVDVSGRAFDVGMGPETGGPVGMAFHRYRGTDGSLLARDSSRGALYLSFTEPESTARNYPDNPHLFISEWLSARHGAFEQISLRWRGSLITEWTNLAAGTGVALFEDPRAASLQALMVVRVGREHKTRLDFLPVVDAAYDEELGSGSDFAVMERGICLALRGPAACGDASTGAY